MHGFLQMIMLARGMSVVRHGHWLKPHALTAYYMLPVYQLTRERDMEAFPINKHISLGFGLEKHFLDQIEVIHDMSL